MSVLVVDIGNTRVKWARVIDGRLTMQRAAAHRSWRTGDFAKTIFGGARGITRVIVASVGGGRADQRLSAAARRSSGVIPEFIVSTRRLGGVTTAYTEPWRFGVDRYAAVIGAHAFIPRRALCVVDVGTAVTIDLVNARGYHLGGAIIPGPQLQVQSLLRNTSGILKRAAAERGIGVFLRAIRAQELSLARAMRSRRWSTGLLARHA